VQLATKEERAQKQAEISAKFDKCWEEASQTHLESRRQVWKDLPALLAADLGTVGFGWLVAWLVILVVRWVQRGFASA
jgi:hypothetical protein